MIDWIFNTLVQSALLMEMTEEWEQCEKKLKDVKTWLEKAKQTLESPLNKKRPLRDQLSMREKMLGDITIQKTKINMSIEKLQIHFRSGVTGQPDVIESSKELMSLLDALLVDINQQSKTLETAVLQLDQLQQVRILFHLLPKLIREGFPHVSPFLPPPPHSAFTGISRTSYPSSSSGTAVALGLQSCILPARPRQICC